MSDPKTKRGKPARARVEGPDHKAIERAVWSDVWPDTDAADRRVLLREADARRQAFEAANPGVRFALRVHLIETPDLSDFSGQAWVEIVPADEVPREWIHALPD